MIIFFTIIRVAFQALGRNKLRSTLTMLGIIIGVSAVIAMVSIGQGAQATIAQQITNAGSNMLARIEIVQNQFPVLKILGLVAIDRNRAGHQICIET